MISELSLFSIIDTFPFVFLPSELIVYYHIIGACSMKTTSEVNKDDITLH